MVVIDQHDLPVTHVDVVGHLHEWRLGRGDDAERFADRASLTRHHAKEQISGARLVALQDGIGE